MSNFDSIVLTFYCWLFFVADSEIFILYSFKWIECCFSPLLVEQKNEKRRNATENKLSIKSNANEVMCCYWKHVWIDRSNAASYFENVVGDAWAVVRVERSAVFSVRKNALKFFKNAREANEWIDS